MNEIINIKSLTKITFNQQNNYTPKSVFSPTTSPNSRLRILSPTNKLDLSDKSCMTQSYQNLIRRDALKKKLNFLTAKLKSNKSEIIKEENAFSDRLLITSFENFVNDTDLKLNKINNLISPMGQYLSKCEIYIPVEEQKLEEIETKISRTKLLLEEKKQKLKQVKLQYQINKQLLQKLKLELDQVVEDHKILEYCTKNKSVKDEIVNHRQNLIKFKQFLLKIDQFQNKTFKERLKLDNDVIGQHVNKFNKLFMQMVIQLDTQIQ